MGDDLEANDVALEEFAARITDYVEPHQTILLEIYSALKINASYPAIPKLFEVLEFGVRAAIDSNLPPRQTWEAWLPTLEYANERLNQLDWRKSAQTRRHGNVLGGAQLEYKVPAALFQDPRSDCIYQYKSLALLLLAATVQHNDIADEKLDRIADEFRRAATSHDGRIDILRQLPAYEAESASSWFESLTKTTNRYLDKKQLSRQQKPFLADIRTLVESISAAEEEGFVSPDTEQPTDLGQQNDIDDLIDDPQPALGSFSTPNIEEIVPTDEPPEARTIFAEEADPLHTEPTSDAGAEAEAKKTRYWLMRQQSATPVDGVLLTIIEKHILYAYLQKSILTETKESISAIVLALMYAVGAGYEKIFSSHIGRQGIFSHRGTYKITITRPPDSYKPTPEAKLSMLPIFETIELPLPGIVQQWFRTRFSNEAADTPMSNILGITQKELGNLIKSSLSELRENGRYRITQRRIECGLATELDSTIRNPNIRHILAGRDNEDSPTIAYYMGHKPERLVKAYGRVIESMFPDNYA